MQSPYFKIELQSELLSIRTSTFFWVHNMFHNNVQNPAIQGPVLRPHPYVHLFSYSLHACLNIEKISLCLLLHNN